MADLKKYYTRSSKTKYYTKEENYKFQRNIREYKLEQLMSDGCETPGRSLLDSSLISRTNIKKVQVKLIQCGDYFQLWKFPSSHLIIDKNMKKMRDKKYDIDLLYISSKIGQGSNIENVDTDLLVKKENKKNTLKVINEKNIRRSRAQLQRLVKANEEEFKTFITLTFAENENDISLANSKFDNWRRSVKRKKSDFKYVCVPEFQKRGAVHYHLLTNLDINKNHDLIIPQSNNKHQYDVRYWNHGFSSVFPMKDINIIGYISKYMTKDIDNRLWGKRRYLYSQNLIHPTTSYLDLSNIRDLEKLFNMMDRCSSVYKNMYLDLNGDVIEFEEFKIRKENIECI